MELRLLINWPWHGKMKLDYPGRPSVIILVFRSRRGRQKRDPERWQHACVRMCSVMSDRHPMDGSPAGSSVHGIIQARILEGAPIFFSRDLPYPRDQTHISWVSCIGKRILYQLNHQWSPTTAKEGLSSSCWLWRRKGPWAKESRWPLEAAEGKVIDASKSTERRQPYRHLDFSPLRPMKDFSSLQQ